MHLTQWLRCLKKLRFRIITNYLLIWLVTSNTFSVTRRIPGLDTETSVRQCTHNTQVINTSHIALSCVYVSFDAVHAVIRVPCNASVLTSVFLCSYLWIIADCGDRSISADISFPINCQNEKDAKINGLNILFRSFLYFTHIDTNHVFFMIHNYKIIKLFKYIDMYIKQSN
jgi:hypothetical protein